MIISKTPCRLSFAGGGSDIESYYREHGGAVVSVTIDKYVYLTLQTEVRPPHPDWLLAHRGSGTSRRNPAPDCAPLPGNAGASARNRDHLARRHSFQGQRAGLVQFVYRGIAERAVCLPGAARFAAGSGGAGVPRGDRPVRRSHRQAGPVCGGVWRPAHVPLPSRRLGEGGTADLPHADAGTVAAQSADVLHRNYAQRGGNSERADTGAGRAALGD